MQKMSNVVEIQEKIYKTCLDEKFISWKWPQANPNPNPKLSPRVRVGANSWENDER